MRHAVAGVVTAQAAAAAVVRARKGGCIRWLLHWVKLPAAVFGVVDVTGGWWVCMSLLCMRVDPRLESVLLTFVWACRIALRTTWTSLGSQTRASQHWGRSLRCASRTSGGLSREAMAAGWRTAHGCADAAATAAATAAVCCPAWLLAFAPCVHTWSCQQVCMVDGWFHSAQSYHPSAIVSTLAGTLSAGYHHRVIASCKTHMVKCLSCIEFAVPG